METNNDEYRNASEALTALEMDIMQYSLEERKMIRLVREHLRRLLDTPGGACVAIAILATNFEVSIKMGQ